MYIGRLIYRIKRLMKRLVRMYIGVVKYILDYKLLLITLIVISAHIFYYLISYTFVLMFLYISLLVVSVFSKSKAILIFSLLIGYIFTTNIINFSEKEVLKEYWINNSSNKRVVITGIIQSPKKEKISSNQYNLKVTKIDEILLNKHGLDVFIDFKKDYHVALYDKCTFTGTLSEYRGEIYINYIKDINCFTDRNISYDKKIFKQINEYSQSIEAKIEKDYHEPYSSLLIGIILGKKRLFEEDFAKAIIASGTSHITAASGFNVSIISIVLEKVLSFLPKRYRIIVIIIMVWFYAILSGLSGSIVRASGVYTISNISAFIGRESRQIVNVFYALAIIYLIDIESVLDIGLILSISATLGILIIKPFLERIFKILKKFEIFSTTLACTISTSPIIVFSFGVFNLNGLLTSILVLPFIEYIFYIGIIQAFISLVYYQPFIFFSNLLISINTFLLSIFSFIVSIFINNLGLNFNINLQYRSLILILLVLIMFVLIPFLISPRTVKNMNYYFKK